jgi:hypothetical protein
MASPLSLFAYLQISWNGKPVFVFKAFFLENRTRKSKVVKLHLISGEPVSIAIAQVVFNVNIAKSYGSIIWHIYRNHKPRKKLLAK